MTSDIESPWETIVVGAGPAGLTAALYLARYRRRVLVLHDGTARALQIPNTHNAPGFDEGIAGPDLIARMSRHATTFGAEIEQAKVKTAVRAEDLFCLTDGGVRSWRGRSLILATGLRLNQIPLPPDLHQAAIDAGVLRYCPICDGFEHIDTRIGVIGCDTQGAAEALFLRRYSSDVTLIPKSHADLTLAERHQLQDADISVIRSPARAYTLGDGEMLVDTEAGARLVFDVIYPALGSHPHTELAEALGIKPDANGCLPADTPFETIVPGLYSAGDVVAGLDRSTSRSRMGPSPPRRRITGCVTKTVKHLERSGMRRSALLFLVRNSAIYPHKHERECHWLAPIRSSTSFSLS